MDSNAEAKQMQLKSLKKELKSWEYSFAEENNRKPTKKDIAMIGEIGRGFSR
jgi:hypothetical protein